MIPMLVSPYLSPASRTICTDHDVAYLDLMGNAHLAFDNVYIDRAVPDRPKTETRALRSIFTPRAAAVLRVMLRSPDRAWRVADLAQKTNVSNVRKALWEREWIENLDDGVALIQPGRFSRPSVRTIAGLSANDYDDRTTGAIKSVLIDIGQILGSFQGKFVVVGGAVPWLLLRKAEMPHIGNQDIYYCVRSFPGRLDTLVEATSPLLDIETAREGYRRISTKFRDVEDFGPTSVRSFVEDSDALGDRTADQWQLDAFGQIDAWLKRIGLR